MVLWNGHVVSLHELDINDRSRSATKARVVECIDHGAILFHHHAILVFEGTFAILGRQAVIAARERHNDGCVDRHSLRGVPLEPRQRRVRLLVGPLVVVDQLEPVDVRQVVHLLEPARQRAHVLEALPSQLCRQEPQHILVELLDRDLALAVLARSRQLVRGHASSALRRLLVLVEPEQADVVGVLVVDEGLDLVLELLGLGGGEDFEGEAVGESHFLLERVQAAVHHDEAELAEQQICTEVFLAALLDCLT